MMSAERLEAAGSQNEVAAKFRASVKALGMWVTGVTWESRGSHV